MPTSITDANLNTTTFLYENIGKPAELTKIISPSPINSTTIIAYDSIGRVASVTDAKGKTMTYTYDEMNRIKEVKDPLEGITRYGYDWKGNLRVVADAKNQTIRYEYDERDRLKKMIDQFNREEIYAYYTGTEIMPLTGDNLKSITDRKGQVTTFNEYDSMNRVKRITYHDGSFTDYTYDLAGRVDYINDSVSGVIDYTYNDYGCTTCSGRGMDRISQEVTPLGTINYTYDVLGRRASMTVAGQQDVVYTYDDVSRLTQITQGAQIVSFASDNAGRRTSMTLPNGIEAAYTYDNANLLTNITYTANSQILKSLNYTYDPNNNRTSFNGHNTLLPDSLAASHDEANEMITLNAESLVYDANGNLIQKGDAIYTWDARNRLVAINSPTMNASFKYDSLGRRIEKTINGQTTKYLYDGWDIMQEIESDTVTTNYLRNLNIDETLGIYRQGNSYYYLHDAIGSTIALTDNLKNIATEYYYDPFGKTQTTNPSIYNPFQYTGRENDGDNHYNYRLRYKVGERFISEDPIRLLGGINFYSYVGNQPTKFIDPFGLIEFIFNTGGHIWFPPTAGAVGVNFSSAWKPFKGVEEAEYRGMDTEYAIASVLDVGVSAGIGGLSGCKGGKEKTLSFGLGKYGGLQFIFRNGRLEGITVGLGVGLSLPITYTIPFEDLLSVYKRNQ